MRVGIGSVSVCLVALVFTSLFWPEGGNEIAPAPAVAQGQPDTVVEATSTTATTVKIAPKPKSDEQVRNEVTEEKLRTKMTAEFEQTRLKEVVALISNLVDAQFHLDKRAMDDAGLIKAETSVTLKLKDVPASLALELLLKDLDLGYHIRHGVVIITTLEVLEGELQTRVYDVRDLIDEAAEKPIRKRIGDGGASTPRPEKSGEKAKTDVPVAAGLGGRSDSGGSDYDSLIDLITSTVTPSAWDEVGGPASISPFRRLLVISHTDEGHREVSKLLKEIRDVLNEKK